MNPYYTDYAEYMSRFFSGKIQKISVSLGTGCPNRDGTTGRGGCIYCDNSTFTPAYCLTGDSVEKQIEAGKKFFARKYPDMRYLVYFQSYTATYRKSVSELEETYLSAALRPDIAGLIVGTRPDCVGPDVTEMLARINRTLPVFVELGVESLHDRTLRLVNRGHTAQQSLDAISRLAGAGLHVGVHVIAGLPGENFSDTFNTIDRLCLTTVESIKMHHLQILSGTRLHSMWQEGKIAVPHFAVDEYLDFCVRIVDRIPRHIAIERFLASAPPSRVVHPKWGLKNYEFTNLLINKLKQR